MRFHFLSIIAIFLLTCKAHEQCQPTLLQLSDNQKITFLDSTNAATAIVTDTVEHFFEHINSLDMCIQLKRKLKPAIERDILLKTYKNALQESVLNFSPDEINFIKNVFEDIFKQCNTLSNNIFPSEIKLIKISGKQYGDGAFYTRENCIIIPESELQKPKEEFFKKVMLHELFHVYSRYNLDKKLELYNLIGFKSIGGMSLLQLDQSLKGKILLNPDGINYAYAIQLQDQETTFSAIPIITSVENDFVESKKKFFDYINFDLYKIVPPFSRIIKVVSDANGKSTFNYKNHSEFFEQITDNTSYIIHPDELMADNFVTAVQSQTNAAELDNLSEAGKKLIDEMIKIISN